MLCIIKLGCQYGFILDSTTYSPSILLFLDFRRTVDHLQLLRVQGHALLGSGSSGAFNLGAHKLERDLVAIIVGNEGKSLQHLAYEISNLSKGFLAWAFERFLIS